MLDPIEHRRRQIENMNKAFLGNNEIEKAWKIGDEKQYQGATWVVGGFNAKGTPLWRKKKDGGGGTASAQTPASKSGSSKVSIDETSIDQSEYDRMHAQAQSVDKNSRSFGLKVIENNIKQTKTELEDTIKNRPGAEVAIAIANLQKKLTMFISQKKATEDVINGAKSSSALTSIDEVKEGSKYKINGETYYIAVMKELKGLPFKAIPFVGLVKESDGSLAAKSGDEIEREIKNGDWEHVTEGKTGTDKKGSQKKDTAASSNETKYFTSQAIHAALRTNEAKKSVGGVYDDDVKKLKEKGIELPPNSASFHFGPFHIDGWLFDKLLSLPEYNGKLKVTDVPGERYKYVSGDLKDIVSIAEDYWNSTEKNILDRVKTAEQNAKQSTSQSATKQDSSTPNIIKLKDFNNVSADRLKRIQGFLQTKDPDNPNNQRILEDDGMDDDRLADLQAVAERNMSNRGLSSKTREYCKKWNLLALDEIHRRNKERKGAK